MIRQLKARWLPALLGAFAVAFTFFFAGPTDIYAANRTEFLFTYGDFAGWLALYALGAFLFFGALLLFVPDKAFPVVFGLVFWLAVMGYVQGTFLNIGISSLMSDDVGSPLKPGFVVFDTVLWVVTGAGCVIGALLMKKHDMIRTAALVVLFVLCGMQLVSCAAKLPKVIGPADTVEETGTDAAGTDAQRDPGTDAGTDADTAAETSAEAETDAEPEMLYLTTAGLCDVAPGKNIVIFLIDRFDVSYYHDLLEFDADFFAPLTGFTCFPDNVSTFSRTYPAVAGMITGIENDFSGKAEAYFEHAYQDSPFLRDLRDNGYSIRLYTDEYYSYRDAASLIGVADNITGTTGYVVTDHAGLAGNMLRLSAYRYLPVVMKSMIKIASGTFTESGTYSGDEPAFAVSDARTYAMLDKGLEINTSYGENAYIFIHLSGCHSPYYMDENGRFVSSGGNSLDASRGCFKMIYHYLDELRRLGLYEDSTIIITGDHPTPVDDYVEPDAPRLTALFVKPAGKSGQKLVTSSAQVSERNLIPTLVRSAGLRTTRQYGDGYFDIPEGKDTERHHLFELTYDNGSSALVDFLVSGPGADFDNWEIVGRKDVGWLYK